MPPAAVAKKSNSWLVPGADVVDSPPTTLQGMRHEKHDMLLGDDRSPDSPSSDNKQVKKVDSEALASNSGDETGDDADEDDVDVVAGKISG